MTEQSEDQDNDQDRSQQPGGGETVSSTEAKRPDSGEKQENEKDDCKC